MGKNKVSAVLFIATLLFSSASLLAQNNKESTVHNTDRALLAQHNEVNTGVKNLKLFKDSKSSLCKWYSKHHDAVSIYMTKGTRAEKSFEYLAKAIKAKMFAGTLDVPVAMFHSDAVPDKDGMICTVYIRGELFINDYTEEYDFNATTLMESAGQIVNKFNDHNRKVDPFNPYK